MARQRPSAMAEPRMIPAPSHLAPITEPTPPGTILLIPSKALEKEKVGPAVVMAK